MKKNLFLILSVSLITFQFAGALTFAGFDYTNFFAKYTNNINLNLNGFGNLFQKVNFGGSFNLSGNGGQNGNVLNVKTYGDNTLSETIDKYAQSDDKVGLIFSADGIKNEGNGTLDKISQIVGNDNSSQLPSFYGDPSSPGYATPTAAQIQERFKEFGKDYVPPNSPNYSSPLTVNSPETSAKQFYKDNPNLVGQPTGNPSVWNGDPATAPIDNPSGNPVNMSGPQFSGKPDANTDSLRSLQDGRFTEISSDGWLSTKATHFGMNINGSPDTGLVSYSLGCPTSMSNFSASGPVRVCNKHTCVVSLPPDVMDYYWGKTDWGPKHPGWTLRGPLPFKNSISSLYRKVAGTPIEVVNLDNKKCTVAPLWETGPAKSECQKGKCGMDLTYCVKVTLLQSTKGLTPVRYRPVPEGKKGCEGYDYVPAPVNSPINKTKG